MMKKRIDLRLNMIINNFSARLKSGSIFLPVTQRGNCTLLSFFIFTGGKSNGIIDFYSKSDRKQKELLLPKQSSGKEYCRVAEGCDDGPCVCRVPQ